MEEPGGLQSMDSQKSQTRLSEVSQKEKNKYCILMAFMESRENGTDEHICRAGIETQT